MSEKRFTLMENISAYDGRVISEYVLDNEKRLTFEEVVDLLNSLVDENEQLKKTLTKTEEEKEHYADLYNECRRFKLSDEEIKQTYADLNRREREKHSQGNATFTATMKQNEVIH